MAEDIQHLLQEIDESLRVDKFEQFWKNHGKLVVAGCGGIVLATLVSVLWKNHLHGEYMRQTDFLIRAEALADAGKTGEAAALFGTVEKGPRGLATLAKLRCAEILMDAGESDKALTLYKEIAAGSGDDGLRDLARLRADIITDNVDKGHADFESNATFGSFADEMTALHLLKAGKNKEAREMLDALVQNDNVPKSERLRALELLGTVPGDQR